jgi:hypothetical protein
MLTVRSLRGKIARCLALLALIAGLIGAAAPATMAAPARPAEKHAAMDCDHGGHPQIPIRHLPGTNDCCMVNVCAMSLALLATPTGVELPACSELPGYDLRVPLAPAGIVAAPLPHPPKSFA